MTSKNTWPESTISPSPDMITPPQIDLSRRGAMQTGQALRKQAEKTFRDKAVISPENLESLSIDAIRHTFHELQVHQIELEMRNEELHRIQEELEVAMARYFDLYDLAPVGYCTISDRGLILEANLAAAKLLGVARGGLIRQLLSRFILKEDQDRYYLFRKKLLDASSALQQGSKPANSDQAGALHDCDLRMVANDGGIFWVNLQVTVAEDAGSAPVHQMVLIDISDRKQAEAQRIKLEDKLRQLQKVESLERMAGAIAHIFNNQLCVVMGNLEMTLKTMADDALDRQNLVNAMEAARRSSETSGLLLAYLGQSNGEPEPLDLSAVCRQNLTKLQASLPDGIVLETKFLSPGPVVYANAKQVQLVLTNLITNGWESIGNRTGRVTVTTGILSTSDIPGTDFSGTDWQNTSQYYGLLKVMDTGSGMTGKELEKIFDPFFSTRFTGRGLGLAVVAGLVKAWGGMIDVKSVVGKGSIFRIFLPLVVNAVPRDIEMWGDSLDFETGNAVLLVENEDLVRTGTEAMLKRLGFTVFPAPNGNEAIALFEKHQKSIRCLITNLTMPGMDGWQTLAALRKIEPQLPAILSIGYDELHAMSGDYAELPQAFLHKPYEMDDFENVLGQVLGGPIKKI